MKITLEQFDFGKIINLYENPLKSPPLEIIKEGNEAIKNYFEQLEKQGKDYIYEAKLMLVGEPGAGKTSLMNKLFDKNFPVPNKNQKSTLGIEIKPNWGFSFDEKTEFNAHVWDFGGQQIQYMLHQFFLTSDCLYILLAEKRRELANFDYWLNILNILAKNRPIIVLFNEINIDSVSSFIYDEKKYKELFPNLSLQNLDINLSDIKDGRFDFLLKTIKKGLSGLEHVGKPVPARWVDIRDQLEKVSDKKHIHINDYFDICSENKVKKEKDQLLILRYFHLLGIVLHFHDDENLCDTLFLDPNWTVDAVYSVLTDKEIEKSNGVLDKMDIYKIWSAKGYIYEEKTKLLQLMLKDNFELCYKLSGHHDKFIVPLLLSRLKPEYEWEEYDNLQFRFQYPFMPKGIVSRLMVRMHDYIEQNKLWHDGLVLIKDATFAQIIEKKHPKLGLKYIEIRLRGNKSNRRDLLTLIREEIKNIQKISFPNLPYLEMIPCICRECAGQADPYFFNYEDIQNYLNKKKTKIDCRVSTEKVFISELIGSVFNIEEIESRLKENMDKRNINIDFRPNIKVHQEQEQQQKQKQEVSQEVKVEVKNAEGLFKNLKEDILDEIDIEIKDEKEKTRIKNDLKKVEKAFSELNEAACEGKKELETGTKNRLEDFIDKLADENSRINKALNLVERGKDKAQKLARVYNKFAPYFALPSVPDVLLGKESNS